MVRIPPVTFEEARAQFPVLERYAYLQAGSVGPLARGTIAAMHGEEDVGVREGRGSLARFMHLLELREALRAEIAALVGVGEEHVALTASTTDGCNIVLAGLGLGPERRGDHDDGRALRAARPVARLGSASDRGRARCRAASRLRSPRGRA